MVLNASLSALSTTLPAVLNQTTLELVVADSGSTLAGTVSATLDLADQGVAIILGGAEGNSQLSGQSNLSTSIPGLIGVGVGVGGAETTATTWTANSLLEPLMVLALSSSACTNTDLSDRTLFPYFARMCIKMTGKVTAMLATFNAYSWTKIAILAQDTNDGWGENPLATNDTTGDTLSAGQNEADYLVYLMTQQTSEAEAAENILRLRLPSVTSLAEDEISDRLTQIQESGLRIIVLYLQGATLLTTMRLASDMGMLESPYVWIGAGSYSGPGSSSGFGTGTVSSGGPGYGLCSQSMLTAMGDITPSIASVDSSAGTLVSLYQSSDIGAASSAATYVYQSDLSLTSNPLLGSMCFGPAVPSTPAFTNLLYTLEDAGLPTDDTILTSIDASVYDSVLVVASAFEALIEKQAPLSASGIWNATDVYAALTAVTLPTQGMMEKISFNSVGDRFSQIDIYNYDPYGTSSGSFVRRGTWTVTAGVVITDAVIFSDGTTSVPADHVDSFTVGETITPTSTSGIIALSYFFVLLPAFIYIYNVRRSVVAFMEDGGIDRQWMYDSVRASGFMAISGLFGMVYLNMLAFNFPTGSFTFKQANFVGGIFLVIFVEVLLVFLPVVAESMWRARKGPAALTELTEEFEMHLHDGEEITTTAQTNAKDKQLAASAKEKARVARQKARKGGLTRDDSAGWLERELNTIWEKTTIGLVLSSAVWGALESAIFYVSIDGLAIPCSISINSGGAFGVFLLQTLLLHICHVRGLKDSRSWYRFYGAWFISASLLASFYANLACVTFTYTGNTTSDPTVDSGAVAIVHAVFFAVPFFVGLLQLIKALKLSRHSLDSVLNGMKAKLASLESGLEQAKIDRKSMAADADHLKRLLELSNLCRPLHRNHALAFTMAESTNTGATDTGLAAAKQFVPASFMQEVRKDYGGSTTPTFARNNITVKVPAGSPQSTAAPPSPFPFSGESVNMSGVRVFSDAPPSPSVANQQQQQQYPPVASPAAAKKSVGGFSTGPAQSQGIATNLTGLDFGFLARPKAEMTGYKLLNELSLELFLASGPVHHRAVADIHLSHILSHPITLEIFKDSLTRSGSQETIAFWLDIQRFKQISDENLRRQVAEAMVATFLYSDAPHPINFLTPASREQLLNVVFAKKGVKVTSFHFIEQELVAALNKDFASFATSTGFKVCAFLLGHSSYRPSTRIKTLNPGGAAVGDGGRMVPMTQNHAPFSGAAEHSGSGAQHDDPHSSVASNLIARSIIEPKSSAPRSTNGGPKESPKNRGALLGQATPTGSKPATSPQGLLRKTTVGEGAAAAKDPQPLHLRNASDVPLIATPADDDGDAENSRNSEDGDDEKKPLSPAGDAQ